MSTVNKPDQKKVTMSRLRKMYTSGEKISAVTAYDYTMARLVDEAGVDLILVGDSLGMVVQGHETTIPVELEHMEYHTRCVAAGTKRAFVVSDLPFMSYQVSHEQAVRSAGQLMKAGAQAIKIEGGEEFGDLIWYLNQIGVPVVGHIGLKPQSVHTMGGYKIQGKSKAEAVDIVNDAKVLEDAGASMLVLEGIPLEVAKEISETIDIPTIGISSGPHCDGQILVCYDLLGANPDFKPKFVRQYMNLHESVTDAMGQYIQDVKKTSFPSERESFHRNLVQIKPVKEGTE